MIVATGWYPAQPEAENVLNYLVDNDYYTRSRRAWLTIKTNLTNHFSDWLLLPLSERPMLLTEFLSCSKPIKTHQIQAVLLQPK